MLFRQPPREILRAKSQKKRVDALKLITGFSIIFSTMYVCSCFAVTDSEIEGLIGEGVTSVEGITKACRAGGDCGSCLGQIADMVADRDDGPGLVPAGALARKSCAA